MTRSNLALILATTLALPFGTGCTSPESTTDDPNHPTPDAHFEAGPFKVGPGEELVMCSYVRADSEDAQDITAFLTEQSQGGHHLIVYTLDHAVDIAPHKCSQGGQPSWNQVLATQLEEEEIHFPEGVGFHVEAHQQYVMETHFINTTAAELEVKSGFGIVYGQGVKERASTYFFGSMNIDVEPHSTFEKTAECHPPKPMTAYTMFGHQHRMGVNVDVMHKPGGSGGDMIYSSTNWETPEIKPFDQGLSLGTDDIVSVSCKWNNTGDKRLRYPHEMCYAIGYYWPADAGIFCATGGGKDTCECREQGALDTGPGGASVEVTLRRKDVIENAGGDLDTGAPIYCALFRAEDYTPLGPKPGTQPYYFRDAVDVVLATEKDTATFDIQDVTPGDYAVSCMMDVIGGGFQVGKGDIANASAPAVTVKTGDVAHVDVLLNFAIP